MTKRTSPTLIELTVLLLRPGREQDLAPVVGRVGQQARTTVVAVVAVAVAVLARAAEAVEAERWFQYQNKRSPGSLPGFSLAVGNSFRTPDRTSPTLILRDERSSPSSFFTLLSKNLRLRCVRSYLKAGALAAG